MVVSRQRGATLVEFAFVLLPLLLLLAGILLYGLVFVTQQAMAFGAQRGADAMVQVDDEGFRDVDGNLDVAGYCASGASLAANRVNRLLPNVGLLNEPNVDVTSRNDPQPGCTVTVTKDFPIAIPLVPLPQTIRGVGFVPAS
ncbi:TadE/TadG family type IV pilus assembly protein [Salinisphaera sp. P385]|uniref:TadE/TadG family type IV pilus assembly protein n=1 Tax=Spectribacter acetivorans TaxID=3075603 RepID=A0ABU3B551_9GAMM|nr:TadE/TadG family type IV pilus assembly protein [Salinisphaera sp. P385]MDT0617584.1 TadE/TadG family type IV pilus assembly protein [Salinisphaera sp. P385]